jgi:hypothetical protein
MTSSSVPSFIRDTRTWPQLSHYLSVPFCVALVQDSRVRQSLQSLQEQRTKQDNTCSAHKACCRKTLVASESTLPACRRTLCHLLKLLCYSSFAGLCPCPGLRQGNCFSSARSSNCLFSLSACTRQTTLSKCSGALLLPQHHHARGTHGRLSG